MRKTREKNERLVPPDVQGRKPEKERLSLIGRYATEGGSNEGPLRVPEKIWFVQLGQVRRHSRTLYLPLDANIVNLFRIRKGDKIKYILLQLIREPAEDEAITDVSENEPIREVGTEDESQESTENEDDMTAGEL
jgi:hypothetical protein